MNYVYLIQNQDNDQWFKCGQTTAPSRRLKEFQCFSPNELEYYALYPCPEGMTDKDCHKALAQFTNVREWFEGDISEAANIVSELLDTESAPTDINEIVNKTRRQPVTSNSDRSYYGSTSFLDVVCPV